MRGDIMASNLAINADLLETALQIGGLKTKKDTVNVALEEFIKRRQMEDIVSLFNTVDYDDTYDYKELRNR
jgi:Arc/MetJ family transcription regulator